MVMHEGNMGFTMEAPREWADRVVSRYEEELDGTTLVFYEKENMLAASGDAEDQGVLFSIKEYRTTDAVLPVGEEVQVLREACLLYTSSFFDRPGRDLRIDGIRTSSVRYHPDPDHRHCHDVCGRR